ncbi:MAG: tyrosine-type recombinase/integrase [Verrucomicrobiota bacterium]|nr:tyrosine-type recombinase/integrase [Verrucomicrobiota bacterium]
MNADQSEAKVDSEDQSPWQKTPVANLVRYIPSGIYFARGHVNGKLIRKSLKTDRISVAKFRLNDLIKEEQRKAEATKAVAKGKMLFKDALHTYRERLKADLSLKERSKVYREERITALLKSWPDLENSDVSKITKAECLEWAGRFGKKSSSTAFNNTVGTLRMILNIGVEAGARYDNPANAIKRMRIRQKQVKLPSHDDFLALVKTIRSNDGGWNHRCADLVEFLAYSGCRKGEAARVTGRDCDLDKGEITVLGDPVTGTKNWEIRRVPIIPDMKRLLGRLCEERGELEFRSNPVMRIKECQGAITSACRKLGIERFTHHDLRHLFATRCIESGVDIPTVSRWLGHKDGGALAMKTYGHLRDQHSANMAQKVVFSELVPNVVQFPPGSLAQSPPPGQSNVVEKKTVAQAKAKYNYPWWASKNPLEMFWGQLNEEVQIVAPEKFHECAKQAMNREVFADELEDREPLKEELAERISNTELDKLASKIQMKRSGPALKVG